MDSRFCLHFLKNSFNYQIAMWVNLSPLKIFFPWILWKGNPKNNTVFLTFDDGPHPQYTIKVLDMLKAERIPATFFLSGKNALQYPGLVESIAREGHAIGNHGFSHARMDFRKMVWIRSEIEKTDHIIYSITGEKPIFFRPPYGRFDLRFSKLMKKTNHILVLWSLLSKDYEETISKALVDRVRTYIHPGAILLFHDGHPNTPILFEAFEDIVRSIRELGFSFQKLSEINP